MKAIRGHELDRRKSPIWMSGNKLKYETHFMNIIFTSDRVDGTIKVPGNTSAAVHLLLYITKMLTKSIKCVFHCGICFIRPE